jgi:hypothetical protein
MGSVLSHWMGIGGEGALREGKNQWENNGVKGSKCHALQRAGPASMQDTCSRNPAGSQRNWRRVQYVREEKDEVEERGERWMWEGRQVGGEGMGNAG